DAGWHDDGRRYVQSRPQGEGRRLVFRAVTNPGYATLRAVPRGLSVTVTEAGWRHAGGQPRLLGYRVGQPVHPGDARRSLRPMVASGTGLPQRDRRAEPGPLCLFQRDASIGRRAEW